MPNYIKKIKVKTKQNINNKNINNKIHNDSDNQKNHNELINSKEIIKLNNKELVNEENNNNVIIETNEKDIIIETNEEDIIATNEEEIDDIIEEDIIETNEKDIIIATNEEEIDDIIEEEYDDESEIGGNNENIIEKKKRGRKPKNDNILNKIEEDKNPKKRGRKPKPKLEIDTLDCDESTPKKRGRKPKEKIYSIINPQEQIFSVVKEEENIILHLPAEIDNFEKPIDQLTEDELLEYNPNINEPEPWNATTKNNFAKIENETNVISENMMKSMKNIEQNEPDFSELYSEAKDDNSDDRDEDISKKGNIINDYFKVIPKKEVIEVEKDVTEILQRFQGVDFEYDHFELRNEETHNYEILNLFTEANKRKEWPQQIGIACWWCCHTFNTPPIPIPYKINRGKYHVYGCCCSYNCAASYIFRENKSDMWEKYSLLNLLYKKIHKCSNVKIRLAPTPLLLRMFGGPMNITEYRESFLINKKDYNILEPPLIAVNPHIEESNYDITSKGKIDNMYSSYTQQSLMKLKRNKPTMKQNNTLESYMSIQINE
jgi:hypothetical protein